jgi:hypothetical protein
MYRRDVVAIALDLVHARAPGRSTTPVHDDHVVTALEQLVDQRAADEQGTADHEGVRHSFSG